MFKPQTLAGIGLSIAMLGWLAGDVAGAAGPKAPAPKASPVILTLGYAGGLLPPQPNYLQIEADGTVIVTPLGGPPKKSRLTPRQLLALLVFIDGQEKFLSLTSAGIQKAIAAAQPPGGPVAMITDGTTTTITLNVGGQVHSVSVYAADTYLQLYPNKPLAEFVAIEQRLQALANSIR